MMRRTAGKAPGSGAQPPLSETDRPASGVSTGSSTRQIAAGAGSAAAAPTPLQQRQVERAVTLETAEKNAQKGLGDALWTRRGTVSEILDAMGRSDSATPFIQLFEEGAATMAGVPAGIRRSEAAREASRRHSEAGNYYEREQQLNASVKTKQTLIKALDEQKIAVDKQLKQIGALVAELGPADPGGFFATLQGALKKWGEALVAARGAVRLQTYGRLDPGDDAYFPLLRKEYEVEAEIWTEALAAPQLDEKRRTEINEYLLLKQCKLEGSPVKDSALGSSLQEIEPNRADYWVRVQNRCLEKVTIGALEGIRSMLELAPQEEPGSTIIMANHIAGLLLLADEQVALHGDPSGLSRPLIGDSLALLIATPKDGSTTIGDRLRANATELDQWASSESVRARAPSSAPLSALRAAVQAVAKGLRERADLPATGEAAADRTLLQRTLDQINAAMLSISRKFEPPRTDA